jgi:hypothetical protein
LGVSVLFEEDHMDTETLTTELMVSVSGALAQQESLSISQNLRMSYQRRMERGEFETTNPPFGYTCTDGCRLTIQESEAEVVRWIFESYLNGESSHQIARSLSQRKVCPRNGNTTWHSRRIQYILTNEKYMGDALCQKYYTPNVLPFVKRRNFGEAGQYYIENAHPAIVSRETFMQVQSLRQQRMRKKTTSMVWYPLRKKIRCGRCGSTFIRKQSQSGLVAWCCGKHEVRAADCPVGRIPEQEISRAFVRMYQRLKQNQDEIFRPALRQLDLLSEALLRGNAEILAINENIAQVSEQSYKLSQLQGGGILDADMFIARKKELDIRLMELRNQRHKLLENEEIQETVEALQTVIQVIAQGPNHVESLECEQFGLLIDHIVVESQSCIKFVLPGNIMLEETLGGVKKGE